MATCVSPSVDNRCGVAKDDNRFQEALPSRPPRAIRQPHRGGYDCEFVKPPSVDFPQTDCPVCLLVLREPYQASCCGNSYCEACVKRVQKDKKCCPTCNEANFTIFLDKRLKRSLYALNVYCCQRREGCEWGGELGELERHLNLQPPPEKLLVGCQFAEVDCTYCVQPFQRRNVQAHQSDDCIKRPYTCQYCNKYETTFNDVTQKHWQVCPFFPLSCPNNCELVLQRQEVEYHVSQDCPLTLVQCDFHMVGCQVQLNRRDMPSHISENLTGHMSLLQVHMMTHPGANMATYLWLMVGSIQRVVIDNANIHSELQEAQETLQDTCEELQQTRDQLQQTCDKLQEAHDEIQQTHDELQQSHSELQTTRHELRESQEAILQLEKTVSAKNKVIVTCAKGLEECSTQLKQHQQNTSLAHKELQEKIQQVNTQLQATITAHEKETTAAQCIIDQHKRESDEKLRAAKDELSEELSTSGQSMQTTLNSQQAILTQQMHDLTEKLSASEHQLQATLATQQTTITECRDETRILQQSLTDQELKSEEKVKAVKDDLTYKITASEQKIQRQEATLTQHQKTLEKVMCTGTLPFEFTMTDFQQHKMASDEWYSPPFYTHTHGYRMCIKVWANGCGSGKGTHLSVFGYLMQGDFDDVLHWPFQGVITIQLLNQLEDKNHHSYTTNFAETTDPKYIGRVTRKERAESGRGKHTFMSHKKLDLDTNKNRQFLKNNHLKFRVSKVTNIDPTALIHKRCLRLESFAEAIEPQVCVVPVEFTLSDFERQKKQNDVWYSPAFYTHREGYRMCLKVYPNGDEEGRRTHVSIFTRIMRGHFDGSLKWPMRGDVTIQIVNQTEENNHHQEIVSYNDETSDDYASRVTGKEHSHGWGFSQFLPHNSLGYNAARNTQYLLRDSLRIQISKFEVKN